MIERIKRKKRPTWQRGPTYRGSPAQGQACLLPRASQAAAAVASMPTTPWPPPASPRPRLNAWRRPEAPSTTSPSSLPLSCSLPPDFIAARTLARSTSSSRRGDQASRGAPSCPSSSPATLTSICSLNLRRGPSGATPAPRIRRRPQELRRQIEPRPRLLRHRRDLHRV